MYTTTAKPISAIITNNVITTTPTGAPGLAGDGRCGFAWGFAVAMSGLDLGASAERFSPGAALTETAAGADAGFGAAATASFGLATGGCCELGLGGPATSITGRDDTDDCITI
jgi:hypothetical protein